MKYLKLFDSVQGLNDAIQGSKISFLGLAYNNGTPVTRNKVVLPQPNDEIWYTSYEGNVVTPSPNVFGANIVSNTYSDGKGVIKFDGNVTSVGDNAFSDTNITSISLPNTVTRIGDYAFSFCAVFESITIPNSVTSIGEAAFCESTELKTLIIPSGVTSIGIDAFEGILNVIYKGSATGSPWGAKCINGYLDGDFIYTDNTKTNLVIYVGDGDIVTIPNTVTSISNGAFSDCLSLHSVIMPNTVTTIGQNIFAHSRFLNSVTLSNNITNIPIGAFFGCGFLTSVTIPSGVTSIGESAFCGCGRLTSITIPSGVTSIGSYAFEYCEGLTSITCMPTTPPSSESGMFSNTNDCPIYVPSASVDTYKAASGWSTYASRIQSIPSE